jgi:hypothetical protein
MQLTTRVSRLWRGAGDTVNQPIARHCGRVGCRERSVHQTLVLIATGANQALVVRALAHQAADT